MPEANDAAAIARRWCEMYSDGTPDSYGTDRFLELYAADCVWTEHSRFGVRVGSREDLRKFTHENGRLMRNRRAVLRRVVADGDAAAMHYAWRALAAEDTPWGAKRGETLGLDVAAFLRVRDGKIVEIEEFLVPAVPAPA